jgi:hypothetical protein
MSYEILGSRGQYWTCQQGAWSDYLKLATAFGWAPEGAFFRDDERGFGPHDSGSYIGNDWQQVGDDDARAFGAALHLAIATSTPGRRCQTTKRWLLKNLRSTKAGRFTQCSPNSSKLVFSGGNRNTLPRILTRFAPSAPAMGLSTSISAG